MRQRKMSAHAETTAQPPLTMMMTSTWAGYNFGVDCAVITLASFSIIGNAFIILLFYNSHTLRTNENLRLMLIMSVVDLLYALGVLPLSAYLITNWDEHQLNYDGLLVCRLMVPMIVEAKLSTVMSIGVAVDRIQALRWPLYYVRKRHNLYIAVVLSVGAAFSLFDFCFLQTQAVARNPGCATFACFTTVRFRVWWTVSHLVLLLSIVPLTLYVVVQMRRLTNRFEKLNIIQAVSASSVHGGSAKPLPNDHQLQLSSKSSIISFKTAQMNRLSLSILCVSILCVLTPCLVVSGAQLLDLHYASYFGPVYILAFLLISVCNIFIYIRYHAVIRIEAWRFLADRRLLPAAVRRFAERHLPSDARNGETPWHGRNGATPWQSYQRAFSS